MVDIKLIDESTDLSNLRNPIGWDLEIGNIPYDVYRVEGYVHTIGGKYGDNCYWACPAGEVPTYDNLIQFDGDAPTWGITFDRINRFRSSSIGANGSCWITRNGKNFYRIPARYMDYGLAKAQYILVQLLEECPLDVSRRNWKEEAIGRKIWYRQQPAVISDITSRNDLFIKPDGKDSFDRPVYFGDDFEDSYVVDLLSPHIYWFRD